MNIADIRKLDVTLLLTFASLLRTRQATATAAELGVTQSSVSHSLSRLRTLFDDQLFIRRPLGMEPTPKAIALEPTVLAIIDLIRQALTPGEFDPAQAHGLVRIGATDHHCGLLTAPLLDRIRRDAPDLKVSFRPLTRKPAVDAVLAGHLDLAIGLFWNLPETIERTPLWQEDYAVVAARRYRRTSEISLEAYLDARHLLVSIDGDLTGIVDKTLRQQGRSRNVVAAVPYFLAALTAAANTDVILTLPRRLANAYAEPFGLTLMMPPLALRRFEVSCIRAARSVSNPLTAWLLGVLSEIADDQQEAGPGIGNRRA